MLQGVELSNIVTTTLAEDHPILKSIQRLKILSTEDENADSNTDEVKQLCDVLNVECAKGNLLNFIISLLIDWYKNLPCTGASYPSQM